METTPSNRIRYALLVGILLLHVLAFWLVANVVIFPAPPASEENTASFLRVATPKAPTQPPPAAVASAQQMPSLLPPTPITPAPVAPIVTTMPNQFTMPKVDTTALMNETLAKLPTQRSAATQPATGKTTSPDAGTSTGPGAACTANFGTMESSLENDGRDGVIVGIKYPSFHHREDRPLIAAVTKEIPSIGWIWANRLTGFFAIVYANQPRDPSLPPVPKSDEYEQALRFADTETQVIAAFFENQPELSASNIKIKTFIVVDNFEDSVENPRPGLQKLDGHQIRDAIDHQAQITASFVSDLRNRHIRLCIISCHYPPYPNLAAYVKESGGIVLYPAGVPLSQAANALKDTVTAK